MSVFYTDLHIHSHYSRATSTKMNIEELSRYAKVKGLGILGTGDFSHPKWSQELKEKLSDAGNGIYTYNGMNFILSNEISLIYTHNKKGRRIHNVILAPSFEVVDQITEFLKSKGRIDYDGRPIFGFNCVELVERLMSISKDIMVIPSHIWTPHYSLFGSLSGFDSVEECFGDQAKHIHALETGLSSNPLMNWRLSALDKYALVSFSDSHSPYPWRLGRECCAFKMETPSYYEIMKIIKNKDKEKFPMTIEFFPEEGKYHYDGHRNCNVCLEPKESIKMRNVCPGCGKPMTIGVLHRVEELADREEGYVPKDAIPFKSLVPLSEIISLRLGTQVQTKKVWDMHGRIIKTFGPELEIMLNTTEEKLKEFDEKLADIILRVREGKIRMQPGFDGVYGHPIINGDDTQNFQNNQTKIEIKQKPERKQKSLLDF